MDTIFPLVSGRDIISWQCGECEQNRIITAATVADAAILHEKGVTACVCIVYAIRDWPVDTSRCGTAVGMRSYRRRNILRSITSTSPARSSHSRPECPDRTSSLPVSRSRRDTININIIIKY